jgi:type I restriction enzyme S subunit
MGSEWREVTLNEIASSARNALVGGPFGSNLVSRDYVDDGVPVIRGQNMGMRWVGGEFAYVAPAKAQALAANLARPGDIVFTQRGTLGQVALVPDEPHDRYLVSQSQMKLSVDREIADPLFFYYVFSGEEQQDYIRQHAIQTGVPHTNLGILRSTPVPLPPIEEQRTIAHILGTLDDKIELNRRMNETLEAIARSLFKSWFVDFGPVRAKCEGRDPGLPPHLADLFPDSFEDSELGAVPMGWRVSGLDEIATYLNGLALQKYPPDDSGSLPVIKIAQLRTGHTDGADRASTDLPPAYVVEDGDILFSWSGSLEVEIWCGGRGALNQHLFKVMSDRFPRWFYFLWTRYHLADFRGIAAGKATTMGHIQRGHLGAAKAVVPPMLLLDAMTERFQPLIQDLVAVGLRSRTLAALRDALLPKLISGQIRVPDAKRSLAVAK